jgi:replication factor C large subunit
LAKKLESNLPWVEKYRPKSLKEMALPETKVRGHKISLSNELTNFINEFFIEIERINEENAKIKLFNKTAIEKEQKKEVKLPPEKAAVLLEGPPGIGKTSIVYALANDLSMEVIETNASDTRTRGAIENKLKETIKCHGIMDFITESKNKLILIDEIDGIYGVQDRGAVPTILELIKNTQFPIIMCSNEYKSNLQPIYNIAKRIEVQLLPKKEIIKIAQNIIKKEKLTIISKEDLDLIIDKNNGDLRGVINDLQGISQGSLQKDNKELILSLYRDTIEEIFTIIRELFQVSSLTQARNLTNKSDVDYNFLYKWVNENLPTFLKSNKDIANAYENLSLADAIFGRIRRNQYWGLLPYFYDLFAGGVALSRKETPPIEGFRRVTFPRYISGSYFSLSNTEQQLAEKIEKYYEISSIEIVQDLLPFLKNLCANSRKQLKNISDWLELDAKEKKLLK